MSDTVTAPPKHVGVLVVCTQEEAELLAAITRGERDTYDTRSEVKVEREAITRVMLRLRWMANSLAEREARDAESVSQESAVIEDIRDHVARWLASPTREEG